MSKFFIEYSDYEKLVELAKQSTSTTTTELNAIINKYSIGKIINEIKVKLFRDVKIYAEGTEENTKAYEKYKTFQKFSDNLKEQVNDKDMSFDMLITAINEQGLDIASMGIQVLT